MITLAKWIIVLFGIYIILAGILMLLAPERARQILRKAGSTNFINYAEITLRMIPAAAMIIYSDQVQYSLLFYTFGWFMFLTSVVLLIVPRQLHHNFSLRSAELIKPLYFQLISPFAFLFGGGILILVL